MKKKNIAPIWICIIIFLICVVFRTIEYFAIRTDETVLAENFIHKLLGIVVLLCAIKIFHWTWNEIGFNKNKIWKNLGLGFLLGLVCFAVAYSVEVIIIFAKGGNPTLKIFASGFSISGEQVQNTGLQFILMCIVFNIINVIMEEGIFRGLFEKILRGKYSFWCANLIIALLFGIWHIVMPLRDLIDGTSNFGNFALISVGYIILAAIMSIKWSMMYKMTGSLWAGIADHLFNNIVATNLLHVVSSTGVDEWQIIRVMLAQAISCIVILIIYMRKAKLNKVKIKQEIEKQ